ncbi:DinB family protein [Tenacibaculum sp. MEBiC06402]|uniref:DinB family protein n=1 Tax=unclassified Tenacibaculum TaxID=2635139 RepID=UPI003B9BE4D3
MKYTEDMEKQEINNLLEAKHQELFNWLGKQEQNYWEKGPEDKWTAGQHVQHLVDSIKKLNHALSFPSFLLKYKFGKSNRAVRSYKEVVKKYQDKLIENKERAKKYNSNVLTPSEKKFKHLVRTLNIQNKKLQYKTNIMSDKKLDNFILPHPLMGKMPLREIIMWTAYHTEHHTKDLIENYS